MQKDKRIDELQKELDSLKAGNAKKLGESGANSGRSETADCERNTGSEIYESNILFFLFFHP